MSFIYLDESGDMGFDFAKSKTSQYFVITCLFVQNKRPVEKIAKNIIRNFNAKERKRHGGALHANSETDRTRRKLLTQLASRDDVSVIAIYLNKKRVYTHLQDQKHILYNFVANILLDRLCKQSLLSLDESIELIASRRETNKLLNENFKSYLEGKVNNNHKIDIKVTVRTPMQEKCLQVVDFASWAIYRNREHKDDSYYNLIKSVVIEDHPLFP